MKVEGALVNGILFFNKNFKTLIFVKLHPTTALHFASYLAIYSSSKGEVEIVGFF